MDNKLQEFERLWTNRFPERRVPDLSFLINKPLNLDMITEVLKKDEETHPALKQMLAEQLKEVQYCLSYILELQLTAIEGKGEEYNADSYQSLYDRFDSPNRPSHLPLYPDKKKIGQYENCKAKKNNEHYMEMKPIGRSSEQRAPSLPFSPHPEMLPKIFFPEGIAEEEKLDYLGQQDFSDGPGSSLLNRTGNFPMDKTKVDDNKRILPQPGQQKQPGNVLPAYKLRDICSQQNAVSGREEEVSRNYSPASSPMSPMGPRSGCQFVIRLIEDCKPLDRADDGLAGLEGYERLLLFKGERLDVIDVWTDEYVARNMKGEIGLVPKDKCEVLIGVSPVLWGREWFLKCPKRHLASELLQSEPVGTFFVRECNSKPGALVLSVKLMTKAAKFQINVKTTKYEVSSRFFPSLDKLMVYYKENAIYLDNGREISLTEPLRHGICT